jgi:serralysin
VAEQRRHARDLAHGRHELHLRRRGRPVQSAGPSWEIKGTGDFNGDGLSDILWQNSDGTPAIWLMNSMTALAFGAVGPFNPGPSWHVEGTGDYNGDNKSDILWQSSDGTPAIWFMDGMTFLSRGAAGSFNPGPDWHVIA